MSAEQRLEARLTALQAMERIALAQEWQRLLGYPVPRCARKVTLIRGLIHHAQIKAFGGLKLATARQLYKIARMGVQGEALEKISHRGRTLQPGNQLIREWNGMTHRVDVDEAGFAWNGTTYTSLSAVARAITGARWSGPRFFGLTGSRYHAP